MKNVAWPRTFVTVTVSPGRTVTRPVIGSPIDPPPGAGSRRSVQESDSPSGGAAKSSSSPGPRRTAVRAGLSTEISRFRRLTMCACSSTDDENDELGNGDPTGAGLAWVVPDGD